VRAQSAHSGPVRLPRRPSTAPSPFSFCARDCQVGPGRQAFPLPSTGGSAAHLQGADRYQPPPPRPSPSNTAIKPAMKLSLHSPSSIGGYPP
jgi:hypothetical protein